MEKSVIKTQFAKKLIYITPEETVRQRAICYIIESLGVPEGEIAVVLLRSANLHMHYIQFRFI